MSEHPIEPDIHDAVQSVSNRYGVAGIEQLIVLAQQELVEARAVLEELAANPE